MSDTELEVEAETEETVEATEEQAAETTEEKSGDEETKVLLSGDGDDGDGSEALAPETYAYEPPEGVEMNDDIQTNLDEFSEAARDMDLTQEQYQAIVDYDVARAEGQIEAAAAGYHERIESWADETKVDKELGGEDLNRNLAVAKLGIETYGTEALGKLLAAPTADNPEGLGLGNHPEIIRLFNRVGATLKESDLIEGDTVVQGEQGLQKMYPSMFKETG